MISWRPTLHGLARIGLAGLVCFGAILQLPGQGSGGFYPNLSGKEVSEVRSALERMKKEPRGPYSRLRWFCADGTVHPPQGTPCRERGGGVQHAELSAPAVRLAELGFHVGMILTGLDFEQFFDADRDHLRLKEQVIQRYLFETDHGWVLRRARTYRGARQIEDEERTGEAFLEQVLAKPDWLSRHFLLAVQLVDTVPHPGQIASGTRRIRNLATEVAEMDPRFVDLRIRIHSFPSDADLAAVEKALEDDALARDLRVKLSELRESLKAKYGNGEFRNSIGEFLGRLDRYPGLRDLTERLNQLRESGRERPESMIQELGRTGRMIRDLVTGAASPDGKLNLLLLDLNLALQQEAFLLSESTSPSGTRMERIQALQAFYDLSYSAGFLSSRELDALAEEIASIQSVPSLSVLAYKQRLNYLARSLDWAAAVVRQTFGPVESRYLLVEPAAKGFFDAVLRASMVFPLAARLDDLQRDADESLRRLAPEELREFNRRLRGVNPGVATGLFRIADPVPANWIPDSSGIYAVPEVVSELRPVAGLVTIGGGSLLSHVQLLARGLQIPNAAAPIAQVSELRHLDGKDVFFAVTPLGLVVLNELSAVSEREAKILDRMKRDVPQLIRLDTSQVRLDRWRPLPLRELRAEDSGVIAGPKAANLGQLAFMFPESVSKGLVLPFGMYYRHVNRPYRSELTLWQEIGLAFGEAARMREQGRPESEVTAFVFPKLEYFRRAIEAMEWIPEDRELIEQGIRDTFADDLGRGVFVRSDTNVEDLARFSGAGLNLTVPNQKTVPDILESVKRLWASPFSERAFLWRQKVLDQQAEVYPSVLMLGSVPSQKSGVLVTTDLEFEEPGCVTVATSEGVGGVVQGESAETLVVCRDGTVKLLSQARAPYRKVLGTGAEGGLTVKPATRSDHVLTEAEIARLREVAVKIQREMPSEDPETIWDVEFGFVDGHLWLFQVRPFVSFQTGTAAGLLAELEQGIREAGSREVNLMESP